MPRLFEAVGIGDPHFTTPFGKGGLAAYITDSDSMVEKLMQQPLAYAAKRGIEHIIIYGDVADGPALSTKASRALLRIFKHDFRFHVILGNHDKFAEESAAGHSLDFFVDLGLTNVRIYEESTIVKLCGQRINFMRRISASNPIASTSPT